MRLKFITAISYSSLYFSDVSYSEINSPSNTFLLYKTHHPTPTIKELRASLQKRLQQRTLEVLPETMIIKNKLSDKNIFIKLFLTF